MDITSVKKTKSEGITSGYKLVSEGRTYYVPEDTNNRHYQAIQEWAAIDGNNIIDNGGGE